MADGRGSLTLVSQGTREFESRLHRLGDVPERTIGFVLKTNVARNGYQRFESSRLRQLGNEVIGVRIKKLRTKAGLTQEGLARKADIPYTTLTKVESGVIKNPSVKVIAKIADALGVSIENLLN